MKSIKTVLINGELYLINYEIILDKYLHFLNIADLETYLNIFEYNNKIILKSDLKKLKLSNFTKLELIQVVGGG
uniref:Thiamine biosynthesis protein n=1 Tax=Eustigmatophyceae sp. Ndem 8/9T-3m6.8 TaxID=2506146 RepID=A0A3R5QMT4_9STRA|nr:Thiamine biosynthesis protein [Eustigmatophyceae sp. Ndem 8/9T-3m6.8]QAA11831.1 Thiamine biosynthesis protein [Eustigmatophyceae sp. Ndem 8/9T-3m6.8]